jgi:hypothetical protein
MSAQVSVHTASFTRPADTTAYASGDLVANSTTAGSVRPLEFQVAARQRGAMIRRVILHKSGTGVTNSSFRAHIYRAAPITVANGDNGVWSTNRSIDYAGAFDVTVDRPFTDGAIGVGVPLTGAEISVNDDGIFVLLEARGAYTPGSAEVFSVSLEVVRN